MSAPFLNQDLYELRTEVYSDNPEMQIEATRQIRKLLSVQDVFSNIALVIDAGVVPRFVEFLSHHQNPDLQFEAAWAITNIAGGTSSETRSIIAAGALEPLMQLLILPNERLKMQSVWALGNIAGDGPELQKLVLDYGQRVVEPLLELLEDPNLQITHANVVAWTVSRLCKCNDIGECPPFDIVKQFIPALARLVYRYSGADDPFTLLLNEIVNHQDTELIEPFLEFISQENPHLMDIISQDRAGFIRIFIEPTASELLINACWALYYFRWQIPHIIVIDELLKSNVATSIFPLLNHYDYKVVRIALKILGYIASGNELQIQVLIDLGVLPAVGVLFQSHSNHVEKGAGSVLTNILAGNPDQIQHVLDLLLEVIIYGLKKDNSKIQTEMKYAVRNIITYGTVEQLNFAEAYLLPLVRNVSTSEELQEIFGWRIGPTTRRHAQAIEEMCRGD